MVNNTAHQEVNMVNHHKVNMEVVMDSSSRAVILLKVIHHREVEVVLHQDRVILNKVAILLSNQDIRARALLKVDAFGRRFQPD